MELKDTRRNRRWRALVRLLDDVGAVPGGCQEEQEQLAWKILNLLEKVR